MEINIGIERLDKCAPIIFKLLVEEFGIEKTIAKRIIKKDLVDYANKLVSDLWVVIEFPYVDKVYRDSYYNYFSSKLNHEKKDCIRISLFNSEISDNTFRDVLSAEKIKKSYLGFIVLRPTPPSIIGRTTLDPKAFKINNFVSCKVKIPVTVNSVKTSVFGFPHSSQDTETITCAETTLWECMEYFGHKYAEYKPILPSHILNVLSKISYERQLPSNGLNPLQISAALKEFGFGSKMYSRYVYGDPEFEAIYNTYIESGIPIITMLQGTALYGHATLGIGRENITDVQIDNCPALKFGNNVTLYEWGNILKQIVIIDDNYPPYRTANFDDPCSYYTNPNFKTLQVAYFVVPLYPKIYLEAYEAKNFILDFLCVGDWKIADNTEIMLRFYLASSRTYKDWLALDSNMEQNVKELILTTAMPKFIWVAELGSKDSFKNKLATGLIILDATGKNTSDLKPLIVAALSGMFINFDADTKEINKVQLDLSNFRIFEKNLYNN